MRLLVASIVLAATAAHADTPTKPVARPGTSVAPDVRQMHSDDCAAARKQNKTCVLDMGKGDDINGTAPTAGGSGISSLVLPKETSLIHLRRDFITEILKSAEDL